MQTVKDYLVTLAPNETAPPGNLGLPDYFGFKVLAVSESKAAWYALRRFVDAFGDDTARHYHVEKVETL